MILEKLNKFIIGNNFLRYTPFWYWYRLICHTGWRIEDHIIQKLFWESLSK